MAQHEDGALPLAEAFDRGPDEADLIPCEDLGFRGRLAAGQPLRRVIGVYRVGAGRLPELQTAAAPVVFLQVDGNAQKPGEDAGVAAEAGPVAMRLEQALLGQGLGGIGVAERSEQEAEDLRPILARNLGKVRFRRGNCLLSPYSPGLLSRLPFKVKL